MLFPTPPFWFTTARTVALPAESMDANRLPLSLVRSQTRPVIIAFESERALRQRSLLRESHPAGQWDARCPRSFVAHNGALLSAAGKHELPRTELREPALRRGRDPRSQLRLLESALEANEYAAVL